MVQTEHEYLDTLKDRLTGYVTSEDLDEILEEYAGHFAIGKSRGRTEEELCRALGSPDDVAKEMRAAYLIHKAEQSKSAGTIWQATRATTRLSGLNFAVVIVPFILFAIVFCLVFIAGLALICGGAVLLLLALIRLMGLSLTLPWHLFPAPGVLSSLGIFVAGIVVVVLDVWLAHFFGRLAIRHLKGKLPAKKEAWSFSPHQEVPQTIAIGRDGASALDLQVHVGAGQLNLGGGAGDEVLMNMTAGKSPGPLAYSTSMDGTTKKVWIRNRHCCSWWSGHDWPMDSSAYTWDIRVSRAVPVAVDIKNHAGRICLALGELNLSSLIVKNSVGETQIDISGYHGGSFDAVIKNGVGELVLRLPKDAHLNVEIHGGIGAMNVRGLMVNGNVYTSSSARPDAPRITCRIKQGVGSITVEAV
ncbi:HAAS signaling domain-containing protein [Methanoregula sp.]|uniref:HAAS signaling domain-containing protein n=1 Tax=Methanoregula sp. TaxID=2052170 RepID=UPI003C75790D